MPDPGLPGAIILILAVVVAAIVVLYLDRRRRAVTGKPTALHSLRHDDFVSFRDRSAAGNVPGVQEEDLDHHWGERG